MKIISQTPDQMILKDSNYWGIFLAAAFFVMAIFFFFAFGSSGGSAPIANVIFPLIITVMLFTLIFKSAFITITINKSDGSIIFQLKRIILSKSGTYHIGDVSRLELQKKNRNTNRGTVLVSQSVIIFKDGSEIPLEEKKSDAATADTLAMGSSGKELSISQQVAAFLNVPFQEVGPDNNSSGIELPGGIQL